MAVPPTSILIKKTLSSNRVISSLQELRKDDWLAIKAYIYIALSTSQEQGRSIKQRHL